MCDFRETTIQFEPANFMNPGTNLLAFGPRCGLVIRKKTWRLRSELAKEGIHSEI